VAGRNLEGEQWKASVGACGDGLLLLLRLNSAARCLTARNRWASDVGTNPAGYQSWCALSNDAPHVGETRAAEELGEDYCHGEGFGGHGLVLRGF
jgi:hypothetical protein